MSDNDNDEPVGERGPDDPITIRIRDQVSQKERKEGPRGSRVVLSRTTNDGTVLSHCSDSPFCLLSLSPFSLLHKQQQ
jgi:hypothetical protein